MIALPHLAQVIRAISAIDFAMAPTKTVKSKFAASKSDKSSSKGSGKPLRGSSGVRKSKLSKGVNLPPPKQQKTKASTGPPKKKRRVYTEKELGLPKLNTITPVAVDLPKGKKKGKVFVDDQARCAIPFSLRPFADSQRGIGEHDDHTSHREREQRRSDREQDDQEPAVGGDSRSQAERS